MMPMNTAWHLPDTNNFQMNFPGTSHMTSKRESVKEQKESMRQTLVKRNIPWDLWEYYIETPEDCNYKDVDETGLHIGVKTILMSQKSVKPWWIKDASMDKLVSLKMKFTAVIQAIEEIHRFVGEEMPDDNQLASEHKQAQKRADKLQSNLQSACNELSALTVIADESFGDEFYDSISAFIEETIRRPGAEYQI